MSRAIWAAISSLCSLINYHWVSVPFCSVAKSLSPFINLTIVTSHEKMPATSTTSCIIIAYFINSGNVLNWSCHAPTCVVFGVIGAHFQSSSSQCAHFWIQLPIRIWKYHFLNRWKKQNDGEQNLRNRFQLHFQSARWFPVFSKRAQGKQQMYGISIIERHFRLLLLSAPVVFL